MPETYAVRVSKDTHVFCAAHFITYNGTICERLHGHNYRATVELHAPLDENSYVFDFVALRDQLQRIVLAWDHHVLLPTEHPHIQVTADERSVEATFQDRRWVFPRGDCVLLPVANTTAELLAREIGQALLRAFPQWSGWLTQLRVEVDECEGQLGVYCYSP